MIYSILSRYGSKECNKMHQTTVINNCIYKKLTKHFKLRYYVLFHSLNPYTINTNAGYQAVTFVFYNFHCRIPMNIFKMHQKLSFYHKKRFWCFFTASALEGLSTWAWFLGLGPSPTGIMTSGLQSESTH